MIRGRLLATSALACLCLFLAGGIPAAHAVPATTTYYVDPSGSDSAGQGNSPGTGAFATIQYAISNVPNPTTDTITIDIASSTYTTGNTEIDINRGFTNLTLAGASATTTIIQPSSATTTSSSRVFNVSSGNTVTLQDMTIQNGHITSSSGAGILSNGTLTLSRVYIYDNVGTGTNVSGGVYAGGTTTINDTTFSGNTGTYVGALYTAGSGNTDTITNTTFYNNSGPYGGIYQYTNNMVVTNTLYANSGEWEIQGSNSLKLKNSIVISGNGGTAFYYYNFSGTITDGGTNIVGGETGSGGSTGPYFSNGVNGTTVVANSTTLSTLNIATTLADNSSVYGIPTLALQTGSVAINGGSGGANGGVEVPAQDERGLYRDSIPDIGPYEYSGTVSAPSFSTPTTPASAIAVGAISQSSTTISWTNGDGSMRAVFMKADATSGSASPVDGTVYGASTVFGSGDQIGTSGWYTVYNGVGTSTVVSNLDTTKNYQIDVVEYNGPYSGDTHYLTTSGTNNPVTKAAYTGSTIYADSSTGNDSTGDGSSGNPYKTFTKAYAAAVDGDTIKLTGTFTWSDTAETGDVSSYGFRIYKNNLTIDGGNAASTTIQAFSSWNTSNDRRVFTLYTSGMNLTVKNVTIAHGDSTSFGGCFGFAYAANLTIDNARLTACRVRNGGSPGGSAIYAPLAGTTLTINGSDFDGNDITSGSNGGTLYLSGSGSNAYITNTTFSGNTMSGGQGNTIEVFSSAKAYFTNDTITGNYGGSSAVATYVGSAYLKNTIVSDSMSGFYNYAGTLSSNGYNAFGNYNNTYIATTTGDWTDKSGSGTYTLTNASTTGSLNLDATTTAANGTVYAPLLASSIAIDAATTTANYAVAIPTVDQLGNTRTGAYDIGAFEYGATNDTTPPTISGVSSGTPSTTSATISWTTDENADSTINYGETVGYGSASSTASYVTTHTITLTGLSSGTTYHFQVESTDPSHNTATTTDYTFTTQSVSSNGSGSETESHSGAGITGSSVTAQVRNLLALGDTTRAAQLESKWPQLFPESAPSTTSSLRTLLTAGGARDLEKGMVGADVRLLQEFLNTHGAPVATTGAGSPGNETTYFGSLTQTALAAYQKAHGINPPQGYFGPITRAYVEKNGQN